MAVGGHLHTSAALTPGEGHDTQCTGSWMGRTGAENLAPPHRDSIPILAAP